MQRYNKRRYLFAILFLSFSVVGEDNNQTISYFSCKQIDVISENVVATNLYTVSLGEAGEESFQKGTLVVENSQSGLQSELTYNLLFNVLVGGDNFEYQVKSVDTKILFDHLNVFPNDANKLFPSVAVVVKGKYSR